MFYYRNDSLFQTFQYHYIYLDCGRRYLDRSYLLLCRTGIFLAERINIL
jgi:hypothetical protein